MIDMSDNITKILFKDQEKKIINNYGVYDYFKYSDYVQSSKMVATSIGDKYIISYSDDSCYHYDLQYIITGEFGNFDFTVIAYADDLLIWKDEEDFSEEEINIILGIVKEVKRYILDTGIPKNIGISSNNINLNCNGNDLYSVIELEYNLRIIKNKNRSTITK